MYSDVYNGTIYAVRGCNDGNQLPNNLITDYTSTYNLGRIFLNLKKYRSEFWNSLNRVWEMANDGA